MGPADNTSWVQTAVRAPPPQVLWGGAHCGGPRAGSGVGTRSTDSAVERSHRTCSSGRQGVRVLQPVLYSSKEGWGVKANFGSQGVEPVSEKVQIQNVDHSNNRESNQIRGLVCHDRSERRLFSHLHPSLSQEVPEVRFRGRSIPISGSSVRPSTLSPHIYQVYGRGPCSTETSGDSRIELSRRLAYFGPVSGDGSSASRCRSWPYSKIGVKTQFEEECARTVPGHDLFGSRVELDYNAGTYVSRTYRVNSGDGVQGEARSGRHCETLSKDAGPHGSGIQHYSSGPPSHEAPPVVVEDQGVLTQRKSVPYDQSNAQVPSVSANMEEALVPIPRASVGGVMSPGNRFDRRLPYGLGRGHGRPLYQGSVAGPSSHLAYKLPGDDGGIQGFEELPPRHRGSPRPYTDRQYVSGGLSEPTGGTQIAPSVQTGASDYPLVPGKDIVNKGNVYPRGSESGSRHPVEAGAEARGMETSSGCGEVDMGEVRTDGSGSVCVSRDVPLSTLVLPLTSSPTGVGCHGTGLAEASPVCFPPDRSAPRGPGEGPSRGHQSTSGCPEMADTSMVLGYNITPHSSAMADSSEEGSIVSGGGHNLPPSPRVVEAVGLASEGVQYLNAGLSAEVVETILSSRAPSTRRLYGLKWKVFHTWCGERRLDPVNCPVASVLEFLQDRFSAGLSPSTLKVYVAAVSAFHAPVDGGPLGRHQLVIRFLRGAWRMRPAIRSRVPAWDLAIVLEGLSLAPFEPLESASPKDLTLKMVFLLAITSLKRVGDLQALAVTPACLEFAPGKVKAFLHPSPGYVPKVPSSTARSVVLQAFHPPPHVSAGEERLHLLCPVRALSVYLEKSASWRRSDQLLVCFGSPKRGLPATKQTISNWIVQAITEAYKVRGVPSPLALRAHSTRGMASSRALLSGVPLQEICEAAGWATPHTFIRFYSLSLPSTPGAHVLGPC